MLFLPSLRKPAKQVGTRPHRVGTKPGPKANVAGTIRCEGGPYWRFRIVDEVPLFVRFRQDDPRLLPSERGHTYRRRYAEDGTPFLRWEVT